MPFHILFEQFLHPRILPIVSKLTKAVALIVLALWGLAVVHCKLEVLPGLDFLKISCVAGLSQSSLKHCEGDGCGAVEDGGCEVEDETVSAPQPLLNFALLTSLIEAPLPELQTCRFVASHTPPDILRIWQFSYRTALPARAPSLVS